MIKIKLLYITAFLFVVGNLYPQIQHGIIRTALRPNKKITYLSDVIIRQRGGHNPVKSNKYGQFEISMPTLKTGEAFYLSSVSKPGYELADSRTIGKAFVYSPNVPIEIVMLNIKEKEEDIRRIAENAYAYAEKKYSERISSLEKLLEEEVISKENYRIQLNSLQDRFERYESLIQDMAKRYASTDYATIDSLNASINSAIENGDLELADSLISTVGSLEKMVSANLESMTKAQQRIELGKQIVNDAASDIANIIKDKEYIGNLLYSKFNISIAQFETDSAAFYIKLRADLDTTNVLWQLEAGTFYLKYIADYENAHSYFQRLKNNACNNSDSALYNCFGGVIYLKKENYSNALKHFFCALEIINENQDAMFGYAISCYNGIGQIYFLQAKYKLALEYFQKSLNILVNKNNQKYTVESLAETLSDIGVIYLSLDRFKEALEYFKQSENLYSSKSEWYSKVHFPTIYINIGRAHYYLGEYQAALGSYIKALDIQKNIYGNNHPDIAICYNNIGTTKYELGEYDAAIEYFEKALKIQEIIHGDNSPNRATTYQNIGCINCIQKDYNAALTNTAKALSIFLSIYEYNHPDIATCYNNMGGIHSEMKNYDIALVNYKKALDIYKNIYEDNHTSIALAFNNIALTYYYLKDYDIAEKYYMKSLNILESIYSNNNPILATCYSNIALIKDRLNDYEAASENYQKALNILKFLYKDNHPDIASCYRCFAITKFNQGDYNTAIEYNNKALKIWKKADGENQLKIITCYNDIGVAKYEQFLYNEALEYYQKALKTLQTYDGNLDPELTKTIVTNINIVESKLNQD